MVTETIGRQYTEMTLTHFDSQVGQLLRMTADRTEGDDEMASLEMRSDEGDDVLLLASHPCAAKQGGECLCISTEGADGQPWQLTA